MAGSVINSPATAPPTNTTCSRNSSPSWSATISSSARLGSPGRIDRTSDAGIQQFEGERAFADAATAYGVEQGEQFVQRWISLRSGGDARVQRVQRGAADGAVLVRPRGHRVGTGQDRAVQRRSGISGRQTAGQAAAGGRKAVGRAELHEAPQRLAHDGRPAGGILAGKACSDGTFDGGVDFGSGHAEFGSQRGVARGRSGIEAQAQQDDEILRAQRQLRVGFGRRHRGAHSLFANGEYSK